MRAVLRARRMSFYHINRLCSKLLGDFGVQPNIHAGGQAMEYRQLGKSGIRVSVIGLGTNRFGHEKMPQEEVNRVLASAVDLGINFLDSADVYTGGRSEETIGSALQGGKRSQFVIATKFYNSTGPGPNDRGASRLHMNNAVNASLKRLQTDFIDLYYVHVWDQNTPLEEMMRGLDDLVRSGKVRYIGASNFLAWQLARANMLADFRGWSPFVVIQSHYHMLAREVESEIGTFCRDQGVGLIPYFPLAGGFLTGKYQRGQPAPAGSRGESNPYVQGYMTDDNYTRLEQLTAWADRLGHTIGDLAQAWLLAKPEVSSVITGATNLEQVQQNIKAAEWKLTPQEVEEVDQVLDGKG
jgi:aryl-alcohol dehydrogenase-like predicted oxidoreductase